MQMKTPTDRCPEQALANFPLNLLLKMPPSSLCTCSLVEWGEAEQDLTLCKLSSNRNIPVSPTPFPAQIHNTAP